ncbi:MAG: tRNA (N(6)-L-threonylcarbamoyladenosine(37)-C(2))-methylthiotransferase MtaB [Deltaproteobacteria bacterium]|nr:tRNA (N(6)-L-threonylcarbamoyladenosine(37)-C(2))-methylthiotransferase MtaB [Deltaproteobacteria bacterium]
MKNVHTYTFGCKVNFFDTTQLEAILRDAGSAKIDAAKISKPDAVVVNTCTVTENADKQANQLIRKIKREHPETKIVVTGCYAQANGDEIASMPEVDHVVSFSEQMQLPSALGWEDKRTSLTLPIVKSNRTRANVKIQDGCKAYCSYCILPYVRGKSQSVSLEHILQQVDGFVGDGHQEVVITGTHIAGYGRDFPKRKRLSDVLYAIYNQHPSLWIRISSLEPVGLTPDFIKAVSEIPTIRPHFHIPLQSGHDDVLKSMNRKYKTKHYQERIEKLVSTQPHVNIGTDVIVGYPGETKEQFLATCEFVKKMPITYLHVFPYSSRPGTKSASMQETVSINEKKKRVRTLMDIGKAKKQAFMQRFHQQIVPVMIEKNRTSLGWLKGITPHYISVHVQGNDRLMQQEVDVELVHLCTDQTLGLYYQGRVV